MNGSGMDATLYEHVRKRFHSARKRAAAVDEQNAFDFVPPAPQTTELFDELQRVAVMIARTRQLEGDGLRGVTIGEVILEYETRTGNRVGGEKMDNKVKEQRQTSWLPRVMKHPSLQRTAEYRRSPVERHHGNPHRVYQHREVNP